MNPLRHRLRSVFAVGPVMRMLMAAALLVATLPAFALGLGQIKVMSKPGQPFLAEIPIISSDPTELQGLEAQLASPETFERIGLPLPQGAASNLQFQLAMDAQGKPVIQVRSSQPVNEPALRFLVEVNWGQGRLVREYSALVDTPDSIAAAAPPPVDAPQAEQLPMIERPAASSPDAVAQGTPESAAANTTGDPAAPTPAASAEGAGAQPTAAASAPAGPPEQTAAAPSTVQAAPAAAAGGSSDGRHVVRRGETLSQIVSTMEGADGYSVNQTMLALLRSNPDAFIGEDINRLRQGAILQMPGHSELSRYDAAQAAVMVRDQVARWRQGRKAVAQPVAEAAGAATATAATAPARPADGNKGAAAAARSSGARLEIAPPQSNTGTQAGIRSGTSAGGEGDMQRQELQQTKENLAARDAEVTELKERVADLERLQKEQAQLLAMKDSALAAAQEKLTTSNAAEPPAQPQHAAGIPVWVWLLPLMLIVVALAALLARRRPQRHMPSVQPGFGDDASAPAPGAPGPSPIRAPVKGKAGFTPAWAEQSAAVAEPAAGTPARPGSIPTWVGQNNPQQPAPAPIRAPDAPVAPVQSSPVPPAPAASPVSADAASSVQPGNISARGSVQVHGNERIQMAQAYLDMGDKITAHSLLTEVIDSGDPATRERAERLLQTIH